MAVYRRLRTRCHGGGRGRAEAGQVCFNALQILRPDHHDLCQSKYRRRKLRPGRRGVQSCLLLGLGVTWGLGFLVYWFAVPCVSLFSSDPQVVEVGAAMMRTIVPLYFFLSIREVYLGVLRGYGNTRMPMLLSLIGMMGLRQVFLAVSMRLRPGLFNIYICCPLAWGTTAAMIAAYYLLTRRRYEPDGQNV